MATPVQLTDAQREMALEHYATLDLKTLTRKVFDDPTLEYWGPEGIAVREHLATQGVKALSKAPKKPTQPPIELTKEQKDRVTKLSPKVDNTLELARLVFANPTLNALTREYRAVWSYRKEVSPSGLPATEEMIEDGDREFIPPATIAIMCGLANDCVPSKDTNKTYRYGALKRWEERQIRALMAYMRNLRFKYQATQYSRQVDRDLYISTFVRFAHDKPDLTETEIDQYISAAVETLNIIQIERDLQRIDLEISNMLNGDSETRGRFMPMVELVNTTRGKLDQSKERLKKLIEGLEGSRNQRIKDRESRSSSFLDLVGAWQKEESVRIDMLRMGQKEKAADKKEVLRIKEMDDVMAIIAGQTESEAHLG